jgi:hypothetical protein
MRAPDCASVGPASHWWRPGFGGPSHCVALTAYQGANTFAGTHRRKPAELMQRLSLTPLATVLALLIVLIWCAAALLLDQSVLAVQKSKALLTLGAANGETLAAGQGWRLSEE